MKNVFKIIASDIKRLSVNVVAMVVIMGLSVLPCLYAWFNIISNWDPYGESSTCNLQVAVASDDEGIVLGGMELNIGDKIIDNLKSNKTIGWVFTDSTQAAVDGVHSGDYYAAITIDSDFSQNLVSFLGGDITNPKITYYENEKKNAIAPKITNKVKTAIQTQVDEAFISTITEVLLNSSEALVSLDSAGNLTSATQEKLKTLDDDMKVVVKLLDSYLTLLDSSDQLMTATESATEAAQSTMDSAESMLDGSEKAVSALSSTIDATSTLVDSNLDTAMDTIDDAKSTVDSMTNAFSSYAQKASSALSGVIGSKLPTQDQANSALENQLNNQGVDSTTTNNFMSSLQTLQSAADKLDSDSASIGNQVKSGLQSAEESVRAREEEYNNTVKPQLKKTSQAANKAIEQTKNILNYDTSSLDQVIKSLDNYPNMMALSKKSLQEARDEAASMESKLAVITGNFDSMAESEKSDIMSAILNADTDFLADFISSPVNLDEENVYPVDYNGSATAPFYIVLSIWVGALIMSTILKTKIKNTSEFDNLQNWQNFVGRYFVTFVIGQVQTLITVVGALLYVGIQCKHPFLLWVACAWTSFVFSLLLYSFTYSFGNVGEAISVILMVIQVAGSGGTFPIEVLPKVFQYLYNMMPFKYAMNAVRECVAGFYHYNYVIDLICLLPFVALAVFIGVVLFSPMSKLNAQIEKSKEKSGILI